MDEQLKAFNEIVNILVLLDKNDQTRIIAAVRLMLDIPHVKHTVVYENN